MVTRKFPSADMLRNDPFFIGFDRLLDRVNHPGSQVTNNYPPYNIIKTDDDHYRVELAVAGFTEEDLLVKVEDGVLTVEGTKADKEEADEVSYLHRGISARNFKRTFTLSDTIVVRSAGLNDGVLAVELENVIPDEKKPRTIEIVRSDPQLLNG